MLERTVNQVLSLLCSKPPETYISLRVQKSQVLQEPGKSFHTLLVYHHHLHSLTACAPGDTLLIIVSSILQALCHLMIFALALPSDRNALYLFLHLLQVFAHVTSSAKPSLAAVFKTTHVDPPWVLSCNFFF